MARNVSDFRMMTQEDDAATSEKDNRTYHILLAEDSPSDVGIVRFALRDENLDHVLHVAKDGAEAIAYILEADGNSKASGFDLLLLDMHLPRHDGEEVLKCLRSTERYAQIPVVVMSSSDAPAGQEKAQKNAGLIYFRKPSRLEECIELGKTIRDILTCRKPITPHKPDNSGGTA
jgi:CheY-like chemotaxis protein